MAGTVNIRIAVAVISVFVIFPVNFIKPPEKIYPPGEELQVILLTSLKCPVER
jgi:hypothetical protein